MKEDIKPVLNDRDGAFWMSYEDFLQRFVSFNVCYVKNWHEVRVKGKFIRTSSVDNEDNDYVLSKFYYHLITEKKQTIVIGVHQEDE